MPDPITKPQAVAAEKSPHDDLFEKLAANIRNMDPEKLIDRLFLDAMAQTLTSAIESFEPSFKGILRDSQQLLKASAQITDSMKSQNMGARALALSAASLFISVCNFSLSTMKDIRNDPPLHALFVAMSVISLAAALRGVHTAYQARKLAKEMHASTQDLKLLEAGARAGVLDLEQERNLLLMIHDKLGLSKNRPEVAETHRPNRNDFALLRQPNDRKTRSMEL